MSKASKYNILLQEGCGRLKNMSPTTPWETKVLLINKLMIQMIWSGYNTKDREIVARRILAKHETDMTNYLDEGHFIATGKTDKMLSSQQKPLGSDI